jgi:LysM repeat protein
MRYPLFPCVIALVALVVLTGCERSAPVGPTGAPSDVTLIPPPSASATGAVSQPYPIGTVAGQAPVALSTNVPTGVPGTAPTPLPQATPAPAQTFPYVVQAGDTLQSIAAKFNTTVEVLRALNNLLTDQVTVGQQLTIPGSPPPAETQSPPPKPTPSAPPAAPTSTTRVVRYVVKVGDRLYRIGLRYGVDWTVIARYNGLSNPNLIEPGDVLLIPLP